MDDVQRLSQAVRWHSVFRRQSNLQSTLCLKQRGERANARLLLKISWEVTDRRSGPNEWDNSGEKETLAVEAAQAEGQRVPPRDRRAFASHGGRREEAGVRSTTDQAAWESRKQPRYEGQRSRAYRRDTMGFRHAGGTRRLTPLCRDRLSAASRRVPAPRTPDGVIARKSGKGTRLFAVTDPLIDAASTRRMPRCDRAGGTTGHLRFDRRNAYAR